VKCKYTTVQTPTAVRAAVRAQLTPVLRAGAYRIAKDWQDNIPHKWPGQNGHITGNTARSITVREQNQTTMAIGTAAISAKALEEGAEPHVITPKQWRHGWVRRPGGGVLAWPEERGGYGPPGYRIRKVAHHPGVSARGIGLWALTRNRSAIQADLIAALARVP
jgi:hypothetical protein